MGSWSSGKSWSGTAPLCTSYTGSSYRSNTEITTTTAETCSDRRYFNRRRSANWNGANYARYFSAGCCTCSAGTFSTDGADACTTCSAGTFSIDGADACTTCPMDKFSSSPDSASCSVCVPGQIAGLGTVGGGITCCVHTPGHSNCLPCPSGKFSPDVLRATCTSCPLSTYSSPGQVSCCLPGDTYSSIARTCISCPPGTFGTNGNNTCHSCPAGQASGVGWADGCTGPDQGKIIGTSSSLDGIVWGQPYTCEISSTTLHLRGTYSRAGWGHCCPNGKFLNPTVDIKTYNINSSITICLDCPAGLFSSSLGTSRSCDQCPEGTGSSTKRSSCCSPGKYHDSHTLLVQQPSCTDCPAAKYSGLCSVDGYDCSSCMVCPAGKNSQSGWVACGQPGQFEQAATTGGIIDVLDTTQDVAGKHWTTIGGVIVLAGCPPGKYGDVPGLVACKNCSAGLFTGEITGSTICKQCDQGQHSMLGWAVCCGIGQTSSPGNVGCALCGAGKFNGAGELCSSCAPGTASEAGWGACCEAGTYGTPGSTRCTTCQPGTFNLIAASSCILCPVGKYSLGADMVCGNTTCQVCCFLFFSAYTQ